MAFLISFSASSLLAYSNTSHFSILILPPATLLTLFTNLSFLGESLRFSRYKIISLAKGDNWTLSFPVWIPFIFSLAQLLSLGLPVLLLNKIGVSGPVFGSQQWKW